MHQAYNEDRKANRLNKPALHKLMALDQVCRELRQLLVQTAFLDSDGCTQLGEWLEELPDGTYPNIAIVQDILNTVNLLPISKEDL